MSGCTLLYSSISAGNVNSAEILLKAGADANALNYNGTNPMLHVCKWQMDGCIELLLKHGGNPNGTNSSWKRTPLAQAITRSTYADRESTVRLLLENGADPNKQNNIEQGGEFPLEMAIMEELPWVVDILLTPRYNKEIALFMCCTREYDTTGLFHNNYLPRDMFNEIMKVTKTFANPNQITASGEHCLNIAIRTQVSEIVESLLKSGADPNHKNDTPPLLVAVEEESKKGIVQLLLKYGADPNSIPDLLETVYALQCPDPEILEILKKSMNK
jgi:ankyrin repeat protein